MFNNRIKAKAKLYFDVDGESVTASEESLSDAAAKVKCIFHIISSKIYSCLFVSVFSVFSVFFGSSCLIWQNLKQALTLIFYFSLLNKYSASVLEY